MLHLSFWMYYIPIKQHMSYNTFNRNVSRYSAVLIGINRSNINLKP
jgi:hypothetical protein